MKNKILLLSSLLGMLLVGCGSPAPTVTPTVTPTETPTVAPTETPTVAPTETPTSPEEREFKFEVIHDVTSYNGQTNYIFTDDDGNYYANIRRFTSFFIMFRYTPAILVLDDIVFDIEDTSIVKRISDQGNKNLKNKFQTQGQGTTTITVYPELEGVINPEEHTFVITINVR